ncbi:unnamed protein product [Parascedosporium putredinis]|uniref:Piwi domain-containing protein n=1 Tax=Parascedosporium putredinis TaxID=1442378 RepID=A0A9P1GZV1_9PEZI|nr:unnamed protein product [Parascedosporium putredinis]CAI7993293.1 unnamed protein product [Parascedosporium putredinis]
MDKFLSASIKDVCRLCEYGFYDYIIVGSGMGGGILAQCLLEQSSTAKDNDIVYHALKHPVNTVTQGSYPYVGGEFFCLGGRGNVWGLYTPKIHPEDLEANFPKEICSYLLEEGGYEKAYQILANDPNASIDSPYPPTAPSPANSWFATKDPGRSLYQFSMGAFSPVNWILDRVYNRDERLTVLPNTRTLTVNRKPDDPSVIVSLTVDDAAGEEREIPVGGLGCKPASESGKLIGKGLMDHDIWGTRFEVLQGPHLATLNSQPLKLNSWVKFNGEPVLVNIAVNADTFLGRAQSEKLPTVYLDESLDEVPEAEFNEALKQENITKSVVQVAFCMGAPLEDANRSLARDIGAALGRKSGDSHELPLPGVGKAGFGVVGHEVGTMRLGEEGQGVVDTNLKVNGISNLYAFTDLRPLECPITREEEAEEAVVRWRGGSGARIFTQAGTQSVPSAEVTKTEDAILSKSVGLQASKLSLTTVAPVRPGFGTGGKAITVWANYVEMMASSDVTLYRYDMSVSPSAVGRKLGQIIRQLLLSSELAEFDKDLVTDFKSTLLSRRRLGGNEITIKVVYQKETHDEPRDDAPTYKVRLLETSTLSVGELVRQLKSADPSSIYLDKMPTIQALNILLNHNAKQSADLVTVGSNKTFSLDPNTASYSLGAGLWAVRGFFASVRAATARVLVNVNVSHGVFYSHGPLDRLMSEYAERNRSPAAQASFIKKLRVTMLHLPERKNRRGQVVTRVKTVLGLATQNDGHGLDHPPRVQKFGAGPKEVEFWMDANHNTQPAPATSSTPSGSGGKKKKGKGGGQAAEGAAKPPQAAGAGKYISVYDYFKQTYKRTLDPNVPIVNVGTRERPTYLPAEACNVLPGQNANTKLSPEQTQNMIRFAVRKPCDNAESITRDGLRTAGLTSSNPLLSQFGLSFSSGLIKVPGRVLPEPKVLYKQAKPVQVRFGGWNMTEVQFNTGGSLKKWSFIVITHPGPATRAARALDLMLVILPSANTPVYYRIKSFGDTRYGLHTVCVVADKLAKVQGQDQYFNNVALKFNLKLGGQNQLVDPTRLGIINEDKTMVIGIDVTHPSPGSSTMAPSIAGMVASIDKHVSQWPGILRVQSTARQEMVSDMKDMLKSRLRLWKEMGRHKSLPENILVYRDGVSEGQYQKVLDEELTLFRDACKEVKRHHTRFFPTSEADADRGSNNPAGTVVDRGVTEAGAWDFYLQSGASPYRNVADVVESLSQTLCYTYGRATKAVSICAPVYYAHILCERARVYLKDVYDATPAASGAGSTVGGGAGGAVGNTEVEPHEKLKNSMFYI